MVLSAQENSEKDFGSSLKHFLNTNFGERYPALEETLERFCNDIIQRENQLIKNYWISENEVGALRCAAVLLTAGIALSPTNAVKTALSITPMFFQDRPDLQPYQHQTIECLETLSEHRPSPVTTFREIFYDAVVAMDAQKNHEEHLILKNSLHRTSVSPNPVPSHWIEAELENLKNVQFKTFAGQILFGKRLEKNITQTHELKSLLEGKGLVEEHERKLLTLYRSISRNMIDMIAIADRKAGLLLSANAISLSLVVSFLSKGLDAHPGLWLPAILIAATCTLTVLFASLAARPLNRSMTRLSLHELLKREHSVLHYGNAARLDLEDFILGFRRMMNDNQLLEDGLIEELHFYSKRIINKLKMVRIAYMTMFSGIFMSFLALILSRKL